MTLFKLLEIYWQPGHNCFTYCQHKRFHRKTLVIHLMFNLGGQLAHVLSLSPEFGGFGGTWNLCYNLYAEFVVKSCS